MTINGSLQLSIANVKAFLTRNFKSRQKLAKNLSFFFGGGNGVEMWSVVFGTPKEHILAQNDAIWRKDRENWCRGLLCTASPEPPKLAESLCTRGHARGRSGAESKNHLLYRHKMLHKG